MLGIKYLNEAHLKGFERYKVSIYSPVISQCENLKRENSIYRQVISQLHMHLRTHGLGPDNATIAWMSSDLQSIEISLIVGMQQ